MDVTGIVGSAATLASVTSFIPQALKITKTRDTSAISTKMYTVTVTGFALWTLYGVLLSSYPLIVANGLCLLLSSFILAMKLLPQAWRDRMLSGRA
jgi:MtN3 and saliva related transmembrane protein